MRSLLRTSREGARRVGEIVAGLRSFSRLDEDTLKCVDLHEGLDATLLLLGSRLDGCIRIDRAYGALPAVECFPGQINQVFMNILSNAIDAVEGDGGITIATTEADERVIVAISDTGCGIMPAHIERIFDPFFTTKDVGQGKGLGLAICHGIIRRHGGTIAVESAPGAGATFTLTLPLTPSPPLPLSS
jgi:signal transduction histidine kinase